MLPVASLEILTLIQKKIRIYIVGFYEDLQV
jgi:hypothetical protein